MPMNSSVRQISFKQEAFEPEGVKPKPALATKAAFLLIQNDLTYSCLRTGGVYRELSGGSTSP